ncbi:MULTISPECIES: hypothetical protein [unclassified Frankia]|uniref:hypothetical protein n=1 Tax=unclassified Frankia TaxID=2632575 RepID=UPI001EF4C899|nr:MULTISPECIES: hypothetical protein [unclassified Frankia]
MRRAVFPTVLVAAGLVGIPTAAQASDGWGFPEANHSGKFVPCGDEQALVDAVTNANMGGANTIRLAPFCTYTITSAHGTGPNGADGLPVITGGLTITGDKSTITRSSTAPAFRILEVGAAGNLTLIGTSISGGNARGALPDDPAGDGGGILNDGGTLTLQDSEVTHNTATNTGGFGADGGGIANEGGTLTLQDSEIADNTAADNVDDDGGGVSNNSGGTVALQNSKIVGNTAGGDGGGIDNKGIATFVDSIVADNRTNFDDGGGINNGGTVTLRDSKIVHNVAARDGGGINNGENAQFESFDSIISGNTTTGSVPGSTGRGGGINNEGAATFKDSKIIFNKAAGPGGGIYNENTAPETPATVTLEGSEVVFNKAADGGGIFKEPGSGPVTLTDSAVKFNTPNNCAPPGSVPGCSG